jgi:hypothetical protein
MGVGMGGAGGCCGRDGGLLIIRNEREALASSVDRPLGGGASQAPPPRAPPSCLKSAPGPQIKVQLSSLSAVVVSHLKQNEMK